MSLKPPDKVRKLQDALHAKAKGSPSYRFYLLYDKVYREDILAFAWKRCRDNGGAPGVDGQAFADIEAYGVDRWLGELTQTLQTKQYRPQAVRRVWIPKPDGGRRPLGIPTIADRVVQTAAMLVLEPIFEADLQPEQYAYRPNRNALEAVKVVRQLLEQGHREVVDADLSGYFDSIPHADLMKSVARRVSDRHMLRLIKMWLRAPVEDHGDDEDQSKARSSGTADEPRGTPQGSPISPLLSSLYMRRFLLAWKRWGHEAKLDAHVVNYADDFVICCRGTATQAMTVMRSIMTRLKLTVNEAKTRIRRMPDEPFDFLGYTFKRCYAYPSAWPYIGMVPSKNRMNRFCRSISAVTSRRWCWKEVEDQVTLLNQKLVGWANYYCLGPVGRAYEAVDAHVRYRLRQWMRHKHKWPRTSPTRAPDPYLYDELKFVRLTQRRRIVSWTPA
jgi:RNA-directed DNA polymerase